MPAPVKPRYSSVRLNRYIDGLEIFIDNKMLEEIGITKDKQCRLVLDENAFILSSIEEHERRQEKEKASFELFTRMMSDILEEDEEEELESGKTRVEESATQQELT